MEVAFPTITCRYAQPYPTGDQIRERGKNHTAMTKGETFNDLWMDDLIYTTAIHASHHLRANGNLDGCIMIVDVLRLWVTDFLHCRMLNELLMQGLFDPEIPPERSNHWMTRLTRYTATVGTELFL
jgi:hypothetical protein